NIDDDHDEFSYDPYMNEMVSQTGMNTLQLSDKLVSIGDRAFHGQCNLSTICLTNEDVTDNIDNAKFADTLVGIGEEAFMYCSYETDEEIEGTDESLYTYYGLKNVVLPDKMSELGNSAFRYDYSLQSVHLPIKGLRTIPENCFSGCGFIEEKPQYTDFDEDGRVEEAPNPGKYHGLTTINLDEMENLLYIKEDAFLRNYCLSAALPDSLRAIGDEAFYQVYNTNSLDFGTEIIYIGEEAFSNTGILDENIDGDYIFMVADFTNSGLSNGKNGLQDVNFAIAANLGKESAKTPDEKWFDYGIDDEAFYRSPIKELDTLSSTAIPEVSYGAFSDCYNLTIALCPDTVEAIKGKAFVNCRKLEQVTFPVYATLTQNMINKECKKVTLIPNLGRYRGKIFTVPMGQRIALPSNSFRNRVNMKISQRVYGESEVPQTDLKPEERIFEIVNGEKVALDIIGSDAEFVGTEGNPGAYAIVSAYVQFEEKTINMSIEYPLDIKAVPAESVRFEEKLFEMSSGTPGHVVESGRPNVPDTLYINGDYVGRKLTLVAAVDPRLPEEAEGHVTENVNWTEETEALKKVRQWLVDEDGDEIEDTNKDGVVDEKDVKGRVLYSAAQYEIKKALPAQEIEAWVGPNKENAEINKIAVSICNPIDDIVYYMDSVGIEESKRISYFEMPEAPNPESDTPSGTTEVIKYSYEYDEDGDATDRTDNLIVYTKNNLNEQNLPIISIVSNDPSKGELEIMALREGEADVYLESATKSEREDFSIRVKKPADGVAPVVVSIESETVDEDGNPEYIDGKGNGFVYQNQTSRFKAVCLPKYATQSVDWSLDDNDGVMTLSNDNGIAVVKGLLLDYDYLIGKTTVTSGSEKAELKINVIEMSEGIEFLQNELSIEAGDKDYIDIVSSRDEKEGLLRLPVESKDIVTFTVEDSNIAKVSTSRDGVYGKSASTQDTIYFTGIKNGSTVLTASTKNGSTSQITINVVEKPITDIRFDTEDITLYEGESRANTATIVPADSTEKIVYSSNDPSIATVDPSTGKVTAVAAGETRIYAEGVLSGEDDYYYVTVTKKATSLLFNKDKDAVYKDEIHSISITTEEDADEGLIIAPEDSHEEVTFTVKDPTIIQVSATDDEGTYGRSCVSTKKCYYKGLKTGETTIECVTASGLKAIYTVRVIGIKIEELAFAKETYTVMAGSTVATKVTKTPSTSDELVEYISDDPSIAKVDANGVITGVKVGETEITAKSVPGGEKAYCKVVVTKKVNPGDPGSTAVSGDAKVRVNSDGKSATYEGSVVAAGAVTIPATVSVGGKTIPVTSIKPGAFKGNTKITKVVIGANVTTIGANAFDGCTKLKTVTIGAKVTTIGNFAFKNCKSLTKIVIPKSVKTIGKQAFAGCSKLKLVTFKTTKLKKVGAKAFKTIKKGAKFKCPKKKLKAYKKMLKKSGLPKKAKVTK
nr:leucine-rich repeat protein [Eubacterium sp.]